MTEKYAVIENINGNFVLKSEHGNLPSAIVMFHGECKGLWNATDVIYATVKIVDVNLNPIPNYTETISHSVEE